MTKASSPSKKIICTPFSQFKRGSFLACMSAHFLERAASRLRAMCIMTAQGTALSMAPMKPSGVTLES